MELKLLGQMDNSDGTLEMCNRVYDTDGLFPTILANSGGATTWKRY